MLGSEATDAENSSVDLISTTRDALGGLWGGIADVCWLVMPTGGCPQGSETARPSEGLGLCSICQCPCFGTSSHYRGCWQKSRHHILGFARGHSWFWGDCSFLFHFYSTMQLGLFSHEAQDNWDKECTAPLRIIPPSDPGPFAKGAFWVILPLENTSPSWSLLDSCI